MQKKWKVPTNVRYLRERYLPAREAFWRGTEEEFVEFLVQMIPQMPPQISDVMNRFFVLNETRRAGDKSDSRFYLFKSVGVDILATRIREAANEKRVTKLLGGIYGN